MFFETFFTFLNNLVVKKAQREGHHPVVIGLRTLTFSKATRMDPLRDSSLSDHCRLELASLPIAASDKFSDLLARLAQRRATK